MASNIQPTGLDWKNLPDKTTPISAENLNKMANTIDDLVTAVNPLNTVEANPEGTPTEGLEKVEIDGTLYEVKGGHKILNDSGTTLTQKDNLQFKGVYTQNNGDNTEVDICRTMTKAQMEALSGEALKGFINTSDEPDSLPLTAEWVGYGNGSVKDGLDNKVSKTGDTMTGDLTIDGTSSSRLFLGNNTNNNIRGIIRMHNTNGKFVQLYPNNTSADRNIELPDKSGTMALTSDLIPTKTQFTPNYGASSDLAARNFFVTDNATFLEIHFCLRCTTAISANVDLVTLPSIAQYRTTQYGVGIESSNNKSHLVYNDGLYMFIDGVSTIADVNGAFAGTFRMSLI